MFFRHFDALFNFANRGKIFIKFISIGPASSILQAFCVLHNEVQHRLFTLLTF